MHWEAVQVSVRTCSVAGCCSHSGSKSEHKDPSQERQGMQLACQHPTHHLLRQLPPCLQASRGQKFPGQSRGKMRSKKQTSLYWSRQESKQESVLFKAGVVGEEPGLAGTWTLFSSLRFRL
eukprot:1152846-Pelagomonas_calceolata.AAC.4